MPTVSVGNRKGTVCKVMGPGRSSSGGRCLCTAGWFLLEEYSFALPYIIIFT